MNDITPLFLPSKFDQYSLNKNPHLNPSLKTNLDALILDERFSNGWVSSGGKDNILQHASLPHYIVKASKPSDTPGFYRDANFYRLRKADKIQRCILKNSFQNEVVLPEKYLYESVDGQKYVVVEKLQLTLIEVPYTFAEAKILACIVLDAGLADIQKVNILRDSAGKLALIDTEPTYRKFKKASYLGGSSECSFLERMQGLTYLKAKSIPEAGSLIESLMTKLHLKYIAIKVTKLIVVCSLAGLLSAGCLYFGVPALVLYTVYAVRGLGISYTLCDLLYALYIKNIVKGDCEKLVESIKNAPHF